MQVVDRNGRLKVEITNAVDELTVGVTNIVGGVSGRALYDNAGVLGELDLASIYVPLTRTLTINGTTQDLSADRTFTVSTGITIGTTAITSGTVGRVLFEGTGNVVQESANLFWDNTNGRLGIGTETPTQALDIANGARIGSAGFGNGLVVTYDGTYINLIRQGATTLIGSGSAGNAFIGTNSNHPFSFLVNGTSAGRIATTGNWLINTTTDAGYKLDVNGTARVSGILSLSSATGGIAYLQDTSASSAFNIFSLSNSGGNFAIVSRTSTGGYVADHYGIVQTSASSSYQRWFTSGVERMRIFNTGNVAINTTTDAGFKLDVNGTARINTLTIGLGGGQVATNTTLGFQAGNATATAGGSTYIGYQAGNKNIGGSITAIGHTSAFNNTNGDGITAIGGRALLSNTTGNYNTAVGYSSLLSNTTGSSNTAIGVDASSGNFTGSVILGRNATATANNQFVVGSSTINAGTVTTEINASTQVWNVVINGVAYKILLA